ncbi:hypothetical protein B0H10DRAFT_2245532 [Mycena sp. CBHHK59/15]|nr:hypothetical protein B0H10DRAFT_2245532 [Mycena sp. CBHHK59/15]
MGPSDYIGVWAVDFNSIDLNFGSNDVGLGGGAFGFPMHFDAGHLVLPAPTLASAAPAGSVGGTTSVFSATTNTNVDAAGMHNKSNDAITSVPAPKTKKRKSASADDVPTAKKKHMTASTDDPPRKCKERSDKGKQRGGDAENKSGGADDPPRKCKVFSDKGKQRAGNAEKGGDSPPPHQCSPTPPKPVLTVPHVMDITALPPDEKLEAAARPCSS